MKLETTAGALKSALDVMRRVVPKRATTPLLETVRFDGAILRATNMIDYAELDLACVRAQGKAAVLFRPLFELVRHIAPDDTIRLDAGAQGACLSFSGGRYDLPTVEHDDVVLGAVCERALHFEPKAFLRGLHFCSSFISTEEIRYYLNGVCLDAGKMIATDGHRLAAYPIGESKADLGRPIIERQTVGFLASMPAPSAIYLNKEATAADFTLPGLRLQSRLIDGSFPEWTRVVPAVDRVKQKITVDRKAFARVLSRLNSVFSYGAYPTLSLVYDADRLALSCVGHSDGSVAREFFDDAVVTGAQGESLVQFNSRYLRDIVRAFDNDEALSFHLIDESSPARITGEGGRFAVLMPMRVVDRERAFDALRLWPRELRAA